MTKKTVNGRSGKKNMVKVLIADDEALAGLIIIKEMIEQMGIYIR